MPRLNVPDHPQHAPRRFPLSRKTGVSPSVKKAINMKRPNLKKRAFLTKDDRVHRAAVAVEERPGQETQQGDARAVQEATKQMPTRDGFGGAPEQID
ncbi:MAG: hypothetical protein SGPRY_008817 [Prymnesium sp.]